MGMSGISPGCFVRRPRLQPQPPPALSNPNTLPPGLPRLLTPQADGAQVPGPALGEGTAADEIAALRAELAQTRQLLAQAQPAVPQAHNGAGPSDGAGGHGQDMEVSGPASSASPQPCVSPAPALHLPTVRQIAHAASPTPHAIDCHRPRYHAALRLTNSDTGTYLWFPPTQ